VFAAMMLTGTGSASAASQFRPVVAAHSDKCLDVSGVSQQKGAAVIQWPCHGGGNQRWRKVDVGGGYFRLVASHSGKCLDVSGASQQNGAAVIQWTCHAGLNQRWRKG
jgi:Ricin-type beta-trefoil lectin domain-like